MAKKPRSVNGSFSPQGSEVGERAQERFTGRAVALRTSLMEMCGGYAPVLVGLTYGELSSVFGELEAWGAGDEFLKAHILPQLRQAPQMSCAELVADMAVIRDLAVARGDVTRHAVRS